ncbi:MAG: type IV toxin-antitoxin system AbiEi family antitoxin [Candidatus Humimicrobiia bacterium]
MIRKNMENEILQYAMEAFKKNVALPVEIEKEAEVTVQNLKIDRLLRIMVQGTELRFYAEVKTNITKAGIGLILLQKAKFPYQILLVTRYVTTQMAEWLKQDNIQFIDTAGNTYINQPPLYIFVKGNKPLDIFCHAPLKRAFRPTGLRVIYAFLCNPGLENKTYRNIAEVADVALGTVSWIIRDLKEMGYLLDMGKRGYKLIKKEDLLNRWVINYPEKLRPKLVLGHFRGPYDWWKQKTLNPIYAQWGGEVAAAKLMKYLKPQVITIYTTLQQLNPLLIENRLKKDPEGDVEILNRFWIPLEMWQYEDMVHPILIYADLMATGNKRNIETARMIYEKYLIRHIRED